MERNQRRAYPRREGTGEGGTWAGVLSLKDQWPVGSVGLDTEQHMAWKSEGRAYHPYRLSSGLPHYFFASHLWATLPTSFLS